jgi:hypothetical protein
MQAKPLQRRPPRQAIEGIASCRNGDRVDDRCDYRTREYPSVTRINASSHAKARVSLGRLIRERQRGDIDSATFRDLIYSMNLLLGFFKLDAEIQIEERLTKIEDEIAGGKQ